jgi:acetyl-CoA acetyltransferase
MGSGPIPAVDLLLARNGLLDEQGRIKDPERIGHWEVNEAFATVVAAFQKYWGVDWQKLNPFGGGIAIGHPLGATGGRCLGLIARELSLSEHELAVFALCMAGGMGKAVLVKRYQSLQLT